MSVPSVEGDATGNDEARRKAPGRGRKLNTMSTVDDEGKERKNDDDRTKAACEEGKLNTTLSHLRSP